jgi:hypothetical protein
MYPVTFYMVIFLQEVAESVKQDFGSIDILVHSLANGPEVKEILILTLYEFLYFLHNNKHLNRSANPFWKHQEKDILQPYLHPVTHMFLYSSISFQLWIRVWLLSCIIL